ncbi:unnamed protein product [Allacma fusca]|uniref:Uncharacterized protein n=1 Tax=Allacma fusca TaxID=39272 RepID=A0A8J2PBE2_9HEXA|nr:unnamed protein product [Allacma fusca]
MRPFTELESIIEGLKQEYTNIKSSGKQEVIDKKRKLLSNVYDKLTVWNFNKDGKDRRELDYINRFLYNNRQEGIAEGFYSKPFEEMQNDINNERNLSPPALSPGNSNIQGGSKGKPHDHLSFGNLSNVIRLPPEPPSISIKPKSTVASYTNSNIVYGELPTFIPLDPTKKPPIPPKTSSHSEKFEDLSNAEKIDLVLTGMFFNTPAGEKFSAKTSPQVLSTPNFEEKSGDTEHFKNKPTPAPRTKTRSNTPTNVDKTPILTPQRQVEESVVPQTHEIGAAAQDLAHVGVKLIRKRLQPSHLPASLKEMATKIEIHSNEFQPTQKLRSDLHLEEPKESPVHYVPPRSKSLRQNVRTIIDKFEPTKQNAHTPAMKPKPDSFRTSENTQKKQKVSDAVHNVDLKIKERIEELRSANNIPKVNITIQPGKLERYNDITSELPKHLNKKMNTVNSLTSQKPLLPPKPQRPPRGNPKSPERGK